MYKLKGDKNLYGLENTTLKGKGVVVFEDGFRDKVKSDNFSWFLWYYLFFLSPTSPLSPLYDWN